MRARLRKLQRKIEPPGIILVVSPDGKVQRQAKDGEIYESLEQALASNQGENISIFNVIFEDAPGSKDAT